MEPKCLNELLKMFCEMMGLALLHSVASLYGWSVRPIKNKNRNAWQVQMTAEAIVKVPNSRVHSNLSALSIAMLCRCLGLVHPDTNED